MSITFKRIDDGMGKECFINISTITCIKIENSQFENCSSRDIKTQEGCRVFFIGGGNIYVLRKIGDVMCDLGFNNGSA